MTLAQIALDPFAQAFAGMLLCCAAASILICCAAAKPAPRGRRAPRRRG